MGVACKISDRFKMVSLFPSIKCSYSQVITSGRNVISRINLESGMSLTERSVRENVLSWQVSDCIWIRNHIIALSTVWWNLYEGVSTSFRTGRPEREPQMVQLSATRCSCIAILWVSLLSFAAITLCVASQRVTAKVSLCLFIDSVRKLLDALWCFFKAAVLSTRIRMTLLAHVNVSRIRHSPLFRIRMNNET
jgi:hypothetical protein